MGYLLMQMFLYLLAALLLGLLLGWILWGRSRSVAGVSPGEADSLRTDNERLRADLHGSRTAMAELEQRLHDAAEKADLADEPAPDVSQPAAALIALPEKKVPRKAKSVRMPPAQTIGAPEAPIDNARPEALQQPVVRDEPIVAEMATTAKDTVEVQELAATDEPAGAEPPAPLASASAEHKTAKPRKPAPPVLPDDLRRIVGIGPVNERLLHGLSVRTFTQIANWTPAEVRRVEEVLQFDGRIERERWIEQAGLLAAGDDEEFARRFPHAQSSRNT